MPAIDFKALSRLPPEERVRVLQRLEDQLQRIIKQRADEIEQSRREIAEAEALLERAKEELVVLEKIATPEARAVRIDDLFFQKPAGKESGHKESALEKAERPDEAVQRRQEQERREQERASLESVASTYQRPEAERPFNPQNEAYRNAIGPPEMQRPEEQKPYKKREERRQTGAEGVYKRKDDE
jgi:hypothetical protein